MASHAHEDKLLIHFFQDSLVGAALSWYMHLERGRIRCWKDLADAFLKQYKYNIDMAPDRLQLQNMIKKENESFKEYAQRWRELAAQVEPPLLEKEMVAMFIDTLQSPFYDRMIGSVSSNFSNIVIIGERVKSGMRTGKIPNSFVRVANTKKPQFGMELLLRLFQSPLVIPCPMKPIEPSYPRGYDSNAKCEYHAGAIGHLTENCRALKFKVQDLINAKWLNFKENTPNIGNNPLPGHGGSLVNVIKEESAYILKRKVEEVTTLLKVIFAELCKANMIKGFVHEESMCDMHPDASHSIENCQEFKHALQTLMDKHLVQIGCPKEKNEVLVIDGQPPAFPKPLVIHYSKSVNTPTPNGPRPITIQVQAPFPYKDNKAVPWRYDARVFVDNQKRDQTKGVSSNTFAISNIASVGGMTRSGRIYTLENLRKEQTREMERSSKGKAKLGDSGDMNEGKMLEIKKAVSDEEAYEFLKFIKQSEYQVVEQLNRTPVKISLLSLLLNSEPHRKILMRVLNEAHVNHDITIDKFGGIVSNIASNNYLTFTDDEVPAEGTRHNKALHIFVKCQDHIIAKVLIDNGSSLNVMPKMTLSKLPCDGSHMKPSAMIVRAFEETRREVIGEIEIPIQIGPCTFQILFQVMDITPAYSCLLGRPWIHSTRVVPSTLHQKLKFIIDNKLVIVSGEDDMLVSKPSSTPYIEVAEEALEIAFQALEIANATYVGEGAPIMKPQLSNASIMTAKVMLNGGCQYGYGSGQIMSKLAKWPQLYENKDRFGLGFTPTKADKKRVIEEKKERRTARLEGREPNTKGVPICDLQKSFYSAGFEFQDSVAVADEEEPKEEVVNLVRICLLNTEIENWKIIELPVVFNAYSKFESDMLESNNASISSNNFDCPINQTDEDDDSGFELSSEMLRLVKQERKVIQPHEEPTETINLGTEEDKKEVKIDMPGLDIGIVEHQMSLKPKCPPVKQKLRRMKPEMSPKKDGKVRMCVDYRDLNRASPKDDFPLPHIDVLVDNTAQHSLFSFMDGYSGYNQIKMAEEDMEKTMFITPWGPFCYRVMPFGLKNAGATYQRAMITLFHDMMHREVEVYVDDMIAKSTNEEDHVTNLHKLFERLRKFKLRLNPTKCTFGVKSGKLLGFIVSQKGIEVDPHKVKAINEILPPCTEKEVCGFLGRLNYIARFISQLTTTCEPIFKLLQKNQSMEWDVNCQEAFEKIKQYLQNPLILVLPVPGKPLIMYLTVLEGFMGCVLGQHDESGRKEHAIYYLSKKFTDYEAKYSLLERTYCALAWKAIKDNALADFLAQQPINDYQLMQCEFPDESIMMLFEEKGSSRKEEWVMMFDGASNKLGHGIRAILISPKKRYIPITARLSFDYTNNIAEYELKGEWETRDAKLIPYQAYIKELIEYFDEITFQHIPREDNQLAHALANLSSMFVISQNEDMPLIKMRQHDRPAYCQMIEGESNGKPWYHDIKSYLKNQEYPLNATDNDKRTLRRLAMSFFLNGEVLYKRNHDMVLLRYVDDSEAQKIMEEIHEGSFGTYANGHAMAKKILRAGYYWLAMETDYFQHAKTCHKCQTYADNVNVPPTTLNVLSSPWPFLMWGIDVIGPIEPKASNGHRFILVAIDYFTKWVKAASYASVTRNVVVKFIKRDLICRYGTPSKLITDNGTNLNNKMMKELCDNFKIRHHNSSPYRPKMNGAVEAANKNIKKIIQKMVVTYRDWHEMLPFTLHGYRTSVCTSIGAIPYSLVYGMEVVLPIEVEIPSLRVLMETKLDEAEWVQSRFDQLNLIEGKRLNALCHGQLYQKRMKKAFDKKVRPREFVEGDMVLKKILPTHKDHRGKWSPNYEGPYVVKKAFLGGALILTNMDGEDLPNPMNSDATLKQKLPDQQLMFFCYFLISLKATVPGLNWCSFFMPQVAGANFLAALVASCFLGAFPPMDLRVIPHDVILEAFFKNDQEIGPSKRPSAMV
ncbi:uncharacterized protein LOC113874337 [Abrus precatorius]|uniref:Uncharacterized protein LOC113874337 n=1 Tax=Abrus precatorius TaxID=3816 RepID=A0A8B8MI23_ABRPR|nr:uncharacterized protein LOC113874337 [Abrus precatorius]